ncbi:pyrimidine-specific ribonucleoside hydrolase RihA [soil metagenome]
MTRPERPRILIDCDPGHDDAIMLVCAAAYADVVGITTVGGNVALEHTTRNALAIATLLGWDVPVHAGADRPLLAEPVTAPEVHGESGMGGTTLPAPDRAVAGYDGIGFLIESAHAEEGLWLVPTGPLTNIALAMRCDRSFAGRLAGICLMGGGASGGNITPAAEFNVFADPEAAAIVFGADCPVRMCGLDLTHQVTGDAAYAQRLRTIGGPAATLVAEIIEDELANFGRYATNTAAPPLHDPVALLAVTHPHLFEGTVTPIHVETGGHLSRGATIVDHRLVTAQGTSPQDLGVKTEWVHTVDGPAALDLIADACARWS